MFKYSLVTLSFSTLLLSGCSTDSLSKQDIGTISGGVVGGLLGSQFGKGDGKVLATAAGIVAGGFLGSNIGKSMDKVDQQEMVNVLNNTKDNTSHSWVDSNNNAKYTMKPSTTENSSNKTCRNYTMSVLIDGEMLTQNGVACKVGNGPWNLDTN